LDYKQHHSFIHSFIHLLTDKKEKKINGGRDSVSGHDDHSIFANDHRSNRAALYFTPKNGSNLVLKSSSSTIHQLIIIIIALSFNIESVWIAH